MRLKIVFKPDEVLRALTSLERRQRTAVPQELNKQRRQSRTQITRKFQPVSNLVRSGGANFFGTPRQQIQQRIKLSKSGTAKPNRWESVALLLVEVFAADDFARLPTGFPAIPQGGLMVKGNPDYVNLGPVAYPIRQEVLRKLADEWPNTMQKRMGREIARVFN